MLAGRELRRRWRRIAALPLLGGAAGGGRGRRPALAPLHASSRSSDVQFMVGSLTAPSAAQLRAFGRVPGVAAFAVLRAFALSVPHAPNLSADAAATDAKFGTVVDRARVVAGRAADPSAVNEV